MIIRGIKFSDCVIASGALSFFGSGYWYDNVFRVLLPGFESVDDVTFVAKTTTYNIRPGNLPLNENYQPRNFFPRCVKAYPFHGAMLNAVGLSSPGAESLFTTGNWQEVKRPFFLSFMPVGECHLQRMLEAKNYLSLLRKCLPEFKAPIGLQINVSCPNTEHDTAAIAEEALNMLAIFRPRLNIPLDVKVNALVKTDLALAIQSSGLCDILTVANTIPFGSPGIDWKKVTGSDRSPLAHIGGGGLSGRPIRDMVLESVRRLKRAGIVMPLKAGGGIMHSTDVDRFAAAGADAIEIATVLALRPWRVESIIKRAEAIFSK